MEGKVSIIVGFLYVRPVTTERKAVPLNEKGKENLSPRELRMLRTLMDLLSHDINNHIYGATGYLELLQSMMDDDETTARFLRNSMKEIRSITQLMDNIKLLVRLVSEPYSPEAIDVGARLRIAMETARFHMDGRELEMNFDHTRPCPKVKGDRFIHDAFFQLLTNSIRSDPEKKVVVDVLWKVRDDRLELMFEDRGRGMKDEVKEGALDRFQNMISEGSVHGKGMGLSVVSAIMERGGGSIRLEDRVASDPSKGLRVVLSIPLFKE